MESLAIDKQCIRAWTVTDGFQFDNFVVHIKEEQMMTGDDRMLKASNQFLIR